jgi:DNA-binding NtrC family response regulator
MHTPRSKYRILVVDDEPLMREYVEEALQRAGYQVDTAGNGADGVALFDAHQHDVVVTDLKMTPMDGIAVLREILAKHPQTRVIVMTAYATIETAISALKGGATDYILKPFSPDVLEVAVTRALELSRLTRENQYLREELSVRYDGASMIGASAPMRRVQEDIHKVTNSRATVLIRGASGTGKELVARAIHHGGNRANKPFIKVNCAALSAGILESELFGHEKGAFTGAHDRKIGRFELADGGTLLLDEVSEINVELQAKLLRALQEREIERVGGSTTIPVDTRIVATSNRNLEEAVAAGKFREDLFFRLNVINLQLPPLRERRDDIPSLADHFLRKFNTENGKQIQGFTDEARTALLAYNWPGNIRELQNAIERAVVLSVDKWLTPRDFQFNTASLIQESAPAGLAAGTTVAEMEQRLIFSTLEHCQQNRTRASELLGISVRTLRNKLNEYQAAGIDVPGPRD